MNGFDIPDHTIARAIASRKNGIGDFDEQLRDRIFPASSAPLPFGPSDFPVKPADGSESNSSLLNSILKELKAQNIASKPVIRGGTASPTATLDWTSVGIMDRLMIVNLGPNTVYFGFDKNGESIPAATCDQAWTLKAGDSVNLTHSIFSKIGLNTGGGPTAVNAIGWQSVAGNQGSAIA